MRIKYFNKDNEIKPIEADGIIRQVVPDANPAPIAEANMANQKLSRAGSNLRVIVQ